MLCIMNSSVICLLFPKFLAKKLRNSTFLEIGWNLITSHNVNTLTFGTMELNNFVSGYFYRVRCTFRKIHTPRYERPHESEATSTSKWADRYTRSGPRSKHDPTEIISPPNFSRFNFLLSFPPTLTWGKRDWTSKQNSRCKFQENTKKCRRWMNRTQKYKGNRFSQTKVISTQKVINA